MAGPPKPPGMVDVKETAGTVFKALFQDGILDGKAYCDASCMWIEGDVREKTATICANPRQAGSRYCRAHHARVYVKSPPFNADRKIRAALRGEI